MAGVIKWWLAGIGWLLTGGCAIVFAGNSLVFDVIDNEKGLVQNTVNALLQDSRGYLWIGTQGGIQRYDGYQLVDVYAGRDPALQLRSSFVTALVEDHENRLWIATNGGGLGLFDLERGEPLPMPRSLAALQGGRANIKAMAADPTGLWLVTTEGLVRVRFADFQPQLLDVGVNVAHGISTAAVLADGVGGALVGTMSNGLLHVDAAGVVVPVTGVGIGRHVLSLVRDQHRQIWVGSNQGLTLLEWPAGVTTAIRPLNAPDVLTTGVRAIASDGRSRLWLSLPNQGLAVYDTARNHLDRFRPHGTDPSSLPDLNLPSLLVDRAGMLWVGTSLQGLARAYAAGDRFELYRDYSSQLDNQLRNHIRTLWQEPDGSLWLGMDDGGLKSLDPRQESYRYHSQALRDTLPADQREGLLRVQAIIAEQPGKLLLGSSAGLFRFDTRLNRAELAPALPIRSGNNNIRALWRDADGRLWLGSNENGLFEMPAWGQYGRRFHVGASAGQQLASDTVLALYRDRHGSLWIGTLNGLNRLRPDGQLQTFRHDADQPHSLCGNLIRHFSETRAGELLIATHSGLCRLTDPAADQPHFLHIGVAEGLPDATVYAALEDDEGHIWLSSNRGITRYSPTTGQMVRYDRHDGLQGTEFNGGAAIRGHDGKFYFGGTRGFNAFVPDHIQLDRTAAPLHVTSIQIGRGDVQSVLGVLSGPVRLDYEDRVLAVQFAALDFLAPHRLQYRYRLVGFDRDWVNAADKREAIYTNLDAGRYQLEVLATNHDGVWSEQPLVVPIVVVPPLWLSRWAIAGYLLAAGLLIGRWWWATRNRNRERFAAESAVRASESRLKWALWGSGDALWDWQLSTGHIFRSGMDRLLGYSPQQVQTDEAWRDRLIHPDDADMLPVAVQRHLRGEVDSFEAEYRMRAANGEWIWIHDRGRVVERDATGAPLRMAGTMKDVTERKRYEDELRQLANYDTLTGLPNRTLFHERLRHALSHARRQNQRVALLFLDLDRFKQINDSLGHSAGDSLLKQVARRLAGSVREDDSVSRLGGDEFTVILEGVVSLESAGVVAEKILKAFVEPYQLGNTEVVVSPSIGISVFPDDGDDSATLLKNADIAMYHAKDQGRNNYQFFVGAMNDTMRRRLQLETSLRRALERDEFKLYYQPKMNIGSGELTGLEALLRWDSAELGRVAPDEFIPLAEETGLIVPIGDWVLREAARQILSWREQGVPVVPIAVNISIRQLMVGDLAGRIADILSDCLLAPEWLQLEITESLVMANAAQAVGRLNALRQLGLRLAVDDFGTGYSSLSYLKRLPIDTIKIDKAFVRDITIDPDDATITRTIIAMAHSLKLTVVAEGVETNDQLQFLRDEGCEEMQGYWLSKPLPADECAEALRKHW